MNWGTKIGEHTVLMKWNCPAITFALALVITCSRGNEPRQHIETLSFEVDESLLGPSFLDSTLGFAFHPPIGWEQVPDTTMEEAKERLLATMGQRDSIQVMPIQFFINLQNGSSCSLSRLTGLDLSDQVLGSLGEYQSLLKTKFSSMKIKEGAFRIDDINVFQFLITDGERIIFKLLCYGPQKRAFQIDYVVPHSVYRQQIKAIESSIGSFQGLP